MIRIALFTSFAFITACTSNANIDDQPGNQRLTPHSDLALVLTSNFDSSSLDVFDPSNPTLLAKRLVLVSGDAVLTRASGIPIIIDRGRYETLTVLGEQLNVTKQFRLLRCGPHDLASVGPHLAFVTCYDSSNMRVVDTQTGETKQVVNLFPWADADGIPEADHVIRFNDYLLVTIQGLNRNNVFTPTAHGLVLRMRISEDRIAEGISTAELPCANPFTPWVRTGSSLVVGCAGFRASGQSAIVSIVPETLAMTTLATEATLGGIPHEIAAGQNGDLIVLISVPKTTASDDPDPIEAQEMRLIRLDSNGKIDILHTSLGYSLTGLAVIGDTIYFGNRSNDSNAGLWWIDANGTHGPVKTSMPPYVIVP